LVERAFKEKKLLIREIERKGFNQLEIKNLGI